MLVRMWRDSDNDYWTFFLLQYLRTSLGFCGWPWKPFAESQYRRWVIRLKFVHISLSASQESFTPCFFLRPTGARNSWIGYSSPLWFLENSPEGPGFELNQKTCSKFLCWLCEWTSRCAASPGNATSSIDLQTLLIRWFFQKISANGSCRIDPRYWQDYFVFAANSPFHDVFSITRGKTYTLRIRTSTFPC